MQPKRAVRLVQEIVILILPPLVIVRVPRIHVRGGSCRQEPPPACLAAEPAVPQRPVVDENDWRISRPAPRAPVRSTEQARPTAAVRATSEAGARAPNLFQRITGAFASPKAPTAAEVPAPAPRSAPENVVSVTPKMTPRPAPAQASINLDVTERTKAAREDDDLQIPAFLRRQAN